MRAQGVSFEDAWNEVRFCAQMIREGKAGIVLGVRSDGSLVRYTKLKEGCDQEYGRPVR